jgi:hypothetical protein
MTDLPVWSVSFGKEIFEHCNFALAVHVERSYLIW